MIETTGYLRIGELSRRTGVSPELLRAWERRYGLLQPDRSPGGFRLYSDEDAARIGVMKEQLANGLSAAEAARVALEPSAVPKRHEVSGPELGASRDALQRSFDAFDELGAHAVLDRLLAAFTVETVLAEVVVPALHELGERWERGEITVAQEHFASSLVRGRLLGLARGWGRGPGPRAILACPPDELHDLGLVVFGIALHARGWRVTYLGADTPLETIADTAERVEPDLVVLAAVMPSRLRRALPEIASLAKAHRVALAGSAAGDRLAEESGAELLGEDPISAADRVAGARAR